ncbi:hypothetical protein BJX99DRAFT_253174 [Aspergillus californicus]
MYHAALVLFKTREEKGTYSIQQLETRESPTIASFSQRKHREPIEVTLDGAFHISGWIDTATSETMIEVEIAGHDLGVFHGIANQSLRIDLQLQFVRGSIMLELNAFDELWVHVDTERGEKSERFPMFDCKKSERLQRFPGLVCEPW